MALSHRASAGEPKGGHCVPTANGAGKTALVKLLLGLYRPTAGGSAHGGRDLQAVTVTTPGDGADGHDPAVNPDRRL